MENTLPHGPADEWMSRRERQVLELHCQAKQAKEIAGNLEIETSTVRSHLGCLMRKLGFSTGKELMRWGLRHPEAIQSGVIRDPELRERLAPIHRKVA